MNTGLEVLQRLDIAACAVDTQGVFVYWNERAAALLRVTREEVLGSDWHAIIRSAQTDECCVFCRTLRAMCSDQPADHGTSMLFIGGAWRSALVVPIPLPAGTVEIVAFLFLDPAAIVASSSSAPAAMRATARVLSLNENRLVDELTRRERDVLACVVDGMDARATAATLGISHATARNYVQRVLAKLGAHNKAEAVSVALAYNLLGV